MPAAAEDESLVSDLDRIHSAGLLLQEQLGQLVGLATRGPLGAGERFCAPSGPRFDMICGRR